MHVTTAAKNAKKLIGGSNPPVHNIYRQWKQEVLIPSFVRIWEILTTS